MKKVVRDYWPLMLVVTLIISGLVWLCSSTERCPACREVYYPRHAYVATNSEYVCSPRCLVEYNEYLEKYDAKE